MGGNMPIYDLGYRHWKGKPLSSDHRWWAITRAGVMMLARRRNFIILFLLSLVPFIIRGGMLYGYFFSEQLHFKIPFLKLDGNFYFDFLSWQLFWIFVMLMYAGSGLIANDLRSNALQIYFSKPIRRLDYLLGKLGILSSFILMVTLVPGLLLFLLHMLFAGDLQILQQYAWISGSIVVYSLILALVNGLLMLAFSSLSRNSRFAGLVFFAVYFFSESVYGLLRVISRDTNWAFCSLKNNYLRVGEAFFGLDSRYNMPVWPSILVLACLMVASFLLLYWRIRPVEVIK
jgi:ABC-2 type transport system permease protein